MRCSSADHHTAAAVLPPAYGDPPKPFRAPAAGSAPPHDRYPPWEEGQNTLSVSIEV